MRKPRSWFSWVIAVSAILHAVSLAYALQRHSYLANDSVQYLTLADNLAREGVWSQSYTAPLVPDVQRTPGYPVLLVALGRSPFLILLFQHLAVIASGLLLVRILRRMVSVRAAQWSGGIWLLQPYPILLSSVLLSETFFLFFLILCWWQLVRWHERHRWRYLAGGLSALVFAAFLRPVAYPLALLAIPLLLYSLMRLRQLPWRRRIPQLLTVLLLPSLSLGAWMVRNESVSGKLTFNSMGDMGMIHGRLGGIEALRRGEGWDEHTLFMAGDSLIALETGLPQVKYSYTAKQNHEVELYTSGLTQYTLEYFFRHPQEAIVFHTKATMQLLSGVGYGWAMMVSGNRWIAVGLSGWQGLCNLLMYVSFVLALWRAMRWPWPLRLGMVAAVVMLAISAVAWADGRYRMIADPVFMACFGWLLHRRLTRRQEPPQTEDSN